MGTPLLSNERKRAVENFLELYERDVVAFHVAMELPIGDAEKPAFVSDAEANLRARLINEEIGETVNKGILLYDMVEVVDGLVDSLYVTLGAATSIGLEIVGLVYWGEPREVHDPRAFLARANYFAEMLIGASRAACSAIDSRNLAAVQSTLAGLVYTLNGVVNAWNIPLRPFWDEVHAANMRKLGPDGKPLRDAGGKVIKPPGWVGPNHGPIFERVFRVPGPESRIDLTDRHDPLCRTNCVACFGGLVP